MVIIAVSYDSASLNSRIDLLQTLGHVIIPASSLPNCRKALEASGYHLLLIGATVPISDRQFLANISKALHPGSKIISVEAPGSLPLQLANRRVPAGDETALSLAIASVISGDSESNLEQRRR